MWNWRLWAGFANQLQPLRQMLWVAAEAENHPAPAITTPVDEPLVLSQVHAPCPPADSAGYGPMQVAGGWARSRGKFSGSDFTLLNERTLECPAGNFMYRREVRQNRLGDLLILFGINPRTCQQCRLKSQCLADGSKGTGGRRITVIRKKLATRADEPSAVSIAQTQSIRVTHLTAQPTGTVLWLDFPTTRVRRELSHQLRQQQIVIESIAANTPVAQPKPQSITRNQRAHRRLTWAERWNRNATTDAVAHWQVKLFGISSAVLNWLSSLKPRPAVII